MASIDVTLDGTVGAAATGKLTCFDNENLFDSSINVVI